MMKSFVATTVIVTGLVVTLWGAGQYVLQKINLQQTEVRFAQSEGYGETEEQKKIVQELKNKLRTNIFLLAGGAFLLFLAIGYLNKPANKVLKKSTQQL